MMDIAEWQNRLENEFIQDLECFGLMTSLLKSEQHHYRDCIKNLRGHLVLRESFEGFFMLSLRKAETLSAAPVPEISGNYVQFMVELVQLLKLFRASELLYMSGYPFTSFQLQRSIRDKIYLLCGVTNRFTTFERMLGIFKRSKNYSMEDLEILRKNSIKEEKELFDKIVREALDLDHHKDILLDWERNFNTEIHGQKFSLAKVMTDYASGKRLPLSPSYDEDAVPMYLNRFGELAWMSLRLLPFLQMRPNQFGDAWNQKWQTLDSSFHFYNQDNKSVEKPRLTQIAEAIEYFIDLRLGFHPEKDSIASIDIVLHEN